MIHGVKGFGIINRTEIYVFLELSCFLYVSMHVGNLISSSSAYSKSFLNICKFMVHILLKLACRILSITMLVCEVSAVLRQLEHSSAFPFFGTEMKTDLSIHVTTAEFPRCWHIVCNTFTASSFSIWNRSTGMSSHPLDLFIVMHSKAHLTSHSRMSSSRWVLTLSWLSRSWCSFLYSSLGVFLPYLLNIFYFC